MILCLFFSNSSWIDWGWLSVGNMERWVMSKSCLQPSDLGTCPVSSPPRLLFPLSWHTCPLRFLCSRCYVLRITKLFGSLCWILALAASPSLTHLTPGSLPRSEGRWQKMEMAHQHGASSNSLFSNISGMWNWDATWTFPPLQGLGDSWLQWKNC